MLDFLGRLLSPGDVVVLPERVARDESALRFGVVVAAWEPETSVLTLDGRTLFSKSDALVRVSRNDVPDDILGELDDLAKLVE